jgi:DNA primase
MIPVHLNFAHLKRCVSIVTVLKAKGVTTPLTKRGDQLFGPCPLHGGDNHNAFVISLSKNLWRCFTGCDTGGDVVELVRRLYGKDYRQTAAFLAALAATGPTSRTASLLQPLKRAFRPFTARLRLNASVPCLRQKQITPTTARRFEAGAYQGAGFLKQCIAVRLHDLDGHPIGYAGRCLDPIQVKQYGKWKFPPGLPKNEILYNFHRIKSCHCNGLVVVECPWGVMRLAQLNIPAVALLGIHLSVVQNDLLKKVSTVVLMLDGDRAGQEATVRIRNALEPYTNVYTITLPSGLDPDDLSDDALSSFTKHFFF